MAELFEIPFLLLKDNNNAISYSLWSCDKWRVEKY